MIVDQSYLPWVVYSLTHVHADDPNYLIDAVKFRELKYVQLISPIKTNIIIYKTISKLMDCND